MNNSDMPAYPTKREDFLEKSGNLSIGLTKREYFAALAMQGMMTRYGTIGPPDFPLISKISIGLADSLLKELEKK